MTNLEQQNFSIKKNDFVQEVMLVNNISGSVLSALILSALNGGSFFMSFLTTFLIFGFYSLLFCIPSAGILSYSIKLLEKKDYSPLKKTILMLLPQLSYLILILLYFKGITLGSFIFLMAFSVPFIFWTFKSNLWDFDLEQARSTCENDDILDDF